MKVTLCSSTWRTGKKAEHQLRALRVQPFDESDFRPSFRSKADYSRFRRGRLPGSSWRRHHRCGAFKPSNRKVIHHNKDCQHVWHSRFGHRYPKMIIPLLNAELVDGLMLRICNIYEKCGYCLQGKTPRIPFLAENRRHRSGQRVQR